MGLIFKKQQHSASSLNSFSQSKFRETKAFERFSELEISSQWDLRVRSLPRNSAEDRKLLNFTHWLPRTSRKYNNFEGKYFWIIFSIRRKSTDSSPEFTMTNEHLNCCNIYSSNILRSLVFVHNVRIFWRKITLKNSLTSSVQ